MTSFRLEIGNRQREFTVTRQGTLFYMEIDGRAQECRVHLHGDSGFVLEMILPDGTRRLVRAAGAANGDDRQLWVDGQTVRYRRVRRQREAAVDGSLATTIPAIVTEILVKKGDIVSAGEKLILLESMKMIIPIQAPFAGTVTAINCRHGEPVQAGVQLINLTKKGEDEQ